MRSASSSPGGTFDKEYNELTGELFFKDTHIADMLGLGRCRLDVTVETLLMIDSLQMTGGQRQTIVDRCTGAAERRIVITHGTDSMAETAAALGLGISGKTIVLTGAMVPYTFGSSDGIFNLGTALAFVSDPGARRLRGHEREVLRLALGAEEPRVGNLRGRALVP